jgi:hypothetical protein
VAKAPVTAVVQPVIKREPAADSHGFRRRREIGS